MLPKWMDNGNKYGKLLPAAKPIWLLARRPRSPPVFAILKKETAFSFDYVSLHANKPLSLRNMFLMLFLSQLMKSVVFSIELL
jgi:hypothetical protein